MTDAFETLKKSIKSLAEEKKYATLRDILTTMNAADVASLFEDIPEETVPLLYRLLPKELAADTFVEMEPDTQHMLIKGFSDNELKEVVDELYVDDAVDLVEEMPANVVKRILIQADAEKRKMINTILQYPDDSAGSIMTTEFVELRPKMTAEEAILHLRRSGINKETINNCYICAKGRQLMGVVTIRDLIMASSEETMEDLMEENIISVSTLEDQETVARQFSKYGFLAMPVVDREERLVGIVTIDDVLDVMEEETTEDIEKMAAIVPADKPYLKQTTFDLWKSRMPWLLLLMISATFTGFIITSFEDALSKYVVLTAYIPMLMDTGGNSGSQASVTVIRGISLKEVEFRDIFRVIWKEVRVALLCGLTLAVCNFGKLLLVDHLTILVAFTICLTLFVTIFCAKVVGCTLPLIASRLGFDPAVMASPFITTIVDAISLLVYFQFATRLLGLG
ncbi:MAG: magnesium transporter [Lachnospiraceae bacterium]|jgi:magnesium transporter|uniref:Magnesium transporter n=1 Tax=Hominisplanchenecus murintestinalis TaxID=2941517 RepID=A0AC61R0W7_9FIRM|nr:magnesium transporter [Hominisplanchenecus murintestinalis]MCI9515608.1 magnesium transporter [Lachnospiraceae bacterium]RKK00935.1 magnesium transporter [Anaerotruncus sp. 1XD22-93]MCI9660136.1 magnesium transporter [Lachnospiraceae bacterium]MDE6907489.1 magnesium transporter [Lachnospiraceae bacterium]NBH96810.1 magnesium transporter [Lachnospiraceae bacterium]